MKKDETREYRIEDEIVVDAYKEGERAIGWHCYLGDTMSFPFKAKCISGRRSSPLKKNEVVKVTGISSEDECEKEILVDIQWEDREFAVPLMQLKGISVDEETNQAIADWHYWVGMGHEF